MNGIGGLLVVFGLGSLVLPLFNLQFRLLAPLDPYQPIAGILIAAIGAVLLAWPMIQARSAGSSTGSTPDQPAS